jgi:hypothetical protein
MGTILSSVREITHIKKMLKKCILLELNWEGANGGKQSN